jgi:hypothetical protein
MTNNDNSVTFHFVTRRIPSRSHSPLSQRSNIAPSTRKSGAIRKNASRITAAACVLSAILWKCDGQCDLCEYHAPDTVSLDDPLAGR